MATKFSSVYKAAKDLVTKPFNFDNKVELKTKAANGATFTTDAAILDDGTAAANAKVEYAHGNFKVDKLSVGTDKKIVGEFSLKEAAPSTDVTFKFTEGSRASTAANDATLGLVHTTGDVTFTLDAELVNGPTFDASALFKYEGFLVGATAQVNTNLGSDAEKDASAVSLADYGALVGYRTDDFTLAANATKALSHVDLSLHHKASSALTAGFIAGFDVAGGSKPFSVTFGGDYKVDSDTTVSAVAASAGTVSVAYKQKLNDLATIKVSGQVDALNLGGDAHKFGLTLSLAN